MKVEHILQTSIYQDGKKVSECNFKSVSIIDGDINTVAKQVYDWQLQYFEPLKNNPLTFFSAKDSLNYIKEFGVAVCTVSHKTDNGSILFQYSQVIKH